MKSSELVRKFQQAGWIEIRQTGQIIPVPFHGAKEMGTGLVNKILKQAGLK